MDNSNLKEKASNLVKELTKADVDFIFVANLNNEVADAGNGSLNMLSSLMAVTISNLAIKTNVSSNIILNDIAGITDIFTHCLKTCGKIPNDPACISNCLKKLI